MIHIKILETPLESLLYILSSQERLVCKITSYPIKFIFFIPTPPTLILHISYKNRLIHFYIFHTTFFEIKPPGCTNFPNLFSHEAIHVSDSLFVHHQEFIHSTLSNGICHTGLQTAFGQDQIYWSCFKAVYKLL